MCTGRRGDRGPLAARKGMAGRPSAPQGWCIQAPPVTTEGLRMPSFSAEVATRAARGNSPARWVSEAIRDAGFLLLLAWLLSAYWPGHPSQLGYPVETQAFHGMSRKGLLPWARGQRTVAFQAWVLSSALCGGWLVALQNRAGLVKAILTGSRGICRGKKWPGGPTLAPWKSHIFPRLTPTTPGALPAWHSAAV